MSDTGGREWDVGYSSGQFGADAYNYLYQYYVFEMDLDLSFKYFYHDWNFYQLKDDVRNRIHKWTCQLKERGLAAPLDIYDTTKGHQDLSYCQKPYDPFNTQFLF